MRLYVVLSEILLDAYLNELFEPTPCNNSIYVCKPKMKLAFEWVFQHKKDEQNIVHQTFLI